VRACIRPYAQAVGKLVAKHIREDTKNGLQVNPRPYIAILLKYPNPTMTAQQFQEKMATQLLLNNNAFALVTRDDNGLPCGIYPIPCTSVEAVYSQSMALILKFTYKNGKTNAFYYSDILHLRRDFGDDDVFGADPGKALSQLMECVGVIDQGIVKAIKNSSIIRWLLKFTSSMRPEDIQKNVKEFVTNYLSYESESFGAAGVDAKVDAKQIEPKDYVPNAAVTDRITDRVYSFFNTNKKIVQSSYTEDVWNAYYESQIEPFAIQLGDVLTSRLFSRKEIAFGNRIVCESSNLQCASMSTKLNLVQFLDRGIMNANEIRAVLNLPPIPGGDEYVRRLDTVPIESTTSEGGEN
jgi:HK97 family phage portal protein